MFLNKVAIYERGLDVRVWGMGVGDCGDCMRNVIICSVAMSYKKIDNGAVRCLAECFIGAGRTERRHCNTQTEVVRGENQSSPCCKL